MRSMLKAISAGITGLALTAAPASADWLEWGEEYDYGLNEYGYGLTGGYDGLDESDDWYYDSYEYGDLDEVTYDSDLFGDDEWEPEDEGAFEDLKYSGGQVVRDGYWDEDEDEVDEYGYDYDGFGYYDADDGLDEDGFYGDELYEDGAVD